MSDEREEVVAEALWRNGMGPLTDRRHASVLATQAVSALDSFQTPTTTDTRFVKKIEAELVRRGYTESDTDPGQWTHPEWDESYDNLLVAVADCFERESERENP